jgi:hypothetical protein
MRGSTSRRGRGGGSSGKLSSGSADVFDDSNAQLGAELGDGSVANLEESSRGRCDEPVVGGEARRGVGEAEAARASSAVAQPTSSTTTRHDLEQSLGMEASPTRKRAAEEGGHHRGEEMAGTVQRSSGSVLLQKWRKGSGRGGSGAAHEWQP